MRKLLLNLSYLLIISFFTSCSTEEIYQDNDILGVWELSSFNDDATDTFTLVFGKNNSGLRISDSEFNSGETISNAVPFSWEKNDRVIKLLDIETAQNTYVITEDSQLVSNTVQDLRLIKVSSDYSKFY